jgi:hypothetical protein
MKNPIPQVHARDDYKLATLVVAGLCRFEFERTNEGREIAWLTGRSGVRSATMPAGRSTRIMNVLGAGATNGDTA